MTSATGVSLAWIPLDFPFNSHWHFLLARSIFFFDSLYFLWRAYIIYYTSVRAAARLQKILIKYFFFIFFLKDDSLWVWWWSLTDSHELESHYISLCFFDTASCGSNPTGRSQAESETLACFLIRVRIPSVGCTEPTTRMLAWPLCRLLPYPFDFPFNFHWHFFFIARDIFLFFSGWSLFFITSVYNILLQRVFKKY